MQHARGGGVDGAHNLEDAPNSRGDRREHRRRSVVGGGQLVGRRRRVPRAHLARLRLLRALAAGGHSFLVKSNGIRGARTSARRVVRAEGPLAIVEGRGVGADGAHGEGLRRRALGVRAHDLLPLGGLLGGEAAVGDVKRRRRREPQRLRAGAKGLGDGGGRVEAIVRNERRVVDVERRRALLHAQRVEVEVPEHPRRDDCLLVKHIFRDARVEGLGLGSHRAMATAVAQVVSAVHELGVVTSDQAKTENAAENAEEENEDDEAEHVGARALLEGLGFCLTLGLLAAREDAHDAPRLGEVSWVLRGRNAAADQAVDAQPKSSSAQTLARSQSSCIWQPPTENRQQRREPKIPCQPHVSDSHVYIVGSLFPVIWSLRF